MLRAFIRRTVTLAAICSLATSISARAAEEPLFDGCPSDQIMSRFIEFGKTGKMPPDLGRWLNSAEGQKIEPWKPFDNVDFVGICWVSAWLIHTDEGTVLIDTLYGPFQQAIIDNIKKTGTDFADIKYVLMTHGHFDHAGGANALKPLLPNATFVMTQAGWNEAVLSAKESQGGRRAWDMVEPDRVVSDGDVIELGSNRFTVVETPGHTWGTASYMYYVQDGENTHRAITIGGLGLNAIDGPEQVLAYIDSVDGIREVVETPATGVDVHLTTHGFSNQLEENRQELMAREPGEPNVFVDSKGLLTQLAGLRQRAVSRLAVEQKK